MIDEIGWDEPGEESREPEGVERDVVVAITAATAALAAAPLYLWALHVDMIALCVVLGVLILAAFGTFLAFAMRVHRHYAAGHHETDD